MEARPLLLWKLHAMLVFEAKELFSKLPNPMPEDVPKEDISGCAFF